MFAIYRIQTRIKRMRVPDLMHYIWNWHHTGAIGDPFYSHGLTLTPAWISGHTPKKTWNEITYPFTNFNGCGVEVWEWLSNYITLYNGCDYLSMMRLKLIYVSKMGPGALVPWLYHIDWGSPNEGSDRHPRKHGGACFYAAGRLASILRC